MRLTRRRLLGSALAGALGGAGIYELVDQLAGTPARAIDAAAAAALPPEQHVLDLGTVTSEGVEVVVPPLHHQVVTAKLRTAEVAKELRAAQAELAYALHALEQEFAPTPAGLGITVAWGLPYFHRFVPGPAARHLPHDVRAGKSALLDAIRFPSDPAETVLEQNDVVFLLRSDVLEHIQIAANSLFKELNIFDVTSIRRGFASGWGSPASTRRSTRR